MKNAIIAVVVLAIIGGGAYALTRNSNNNSNKPTTKSTTQQQAPNTTSNSSSSNTEQSSGATITYSDNGFSPSTLTVKAGTTVTIKNTSSGDMQLASNPHPTHTDDPELNVGLVQSGQSMTFTVNTKGTHGYHNHLNPSDTGTIIVE